jgi:hypothetical protein
MRIFLASVIAIGMIGCKSNADVSESAKLDAKYYLNGYYPLADGRKLIPELGSLSQEECQDALKAGFDHVLKTQEGLDDGGKVAAANLAKAQDRDAQLIAYAKQRCTELIELKKKSDANVAEKTKAGATAKSQSKRTRKSANKSTDAGTQTDDENTANSEDKAAGSGTAEKTERK